MTSLNNKDRIMLINGCSHAAGFEIDGTDDSAYNRAHSFGSVLAKKMGYQPVNIALGSQSNPAIARGVLDWFHTHYNPNSMEVFVCVAWTESIRIDFPSPYCMDYASANKHVDYYCKHTEQYMQINAGWPGAKPLEQRIIKYWQDVQARYPKYLEIVSMNAALQLQYFFKMHSVEYVMCNTMHMFTTPCNHLNFYTKLVDQSRYYCMLDNDESFYWHYKNLGYNNEKAKYWHHSEQPHLLQAQKLYDFIN